jgi:hypothetical protein
MPETGSVLDLAPQQEQSSVSVRVGVASATTVTEAGVVQRQVTTPSLSFLELRASNEGLPILDTFL